MDDHSVVEQNENSCSPKFDGRSSLLENSSNMDVNLSTDVELCDIPRTCEDGAPKDIVVQEADTSELMYKEVANDDEAYKLYSSYAFRCGFGVRKDKKAYRSGTKIIRQRIFLCSCEGAKQKEDDKPKAFFKLEKRTGCKAHIQFDVDKSTGVYVVVKHHMIHNHEMVHVSKRHLLRSHRSVSKEQLEMINNLRDSGVGVADCVRVLRNEVGGSANLGFTQKDAYDAVAKEKRNKLDGCDSNQLIKYFSQRQAKESDFYYDIQLNEENELINFFWRDGRMKRDYDVFGDLLVHDTTYKTNKYNMICGPFVGVNQHNRNVMFAVGFLLTENTESFIWLFETFLKSMGGMHPITIMTDQSASMAAAISIVFPNTRHRLCTWHITENSKKRIKGLRSKEGFSDLFNIVLKYTDTESEFEHYWACMIHKYNCQSNEWLQRLYSLRRMWCPAFSKDKFSGGILSSQRSESTNNSLKKRLFATQGLCDFYKVFVDVVAEWRDKENDEDHQSLTGNRHLAFAEVSLIQHAKQVYTVNMFLKFEENFIKSASCQQKVILCKPPSVEYHVRRSNLDLIDHTVAFNPTTLTVDCTCNLFGEMGLLCCHALRIFHINNVGKIPNRYIMGRWTKKAMCTRVDDDIEQDSDVVQASVWRTQYVRTFIEIANNAQHDAAVRKLVAHTIDSLKDNVENLVGKFKDSLTIEDVDNMLNPKVKDPPKKRKKGERDFRHKSIVEKEGNKLKGWKKRAEKATIRSKAKAQHSVQEYLHIPPGGSVSHSTTQESLLDVHTPDDYFGVNILM